MAGINDFTTTPGLARKRTAQQAFMTPKPSLAQDASSDKRKQTEAGPFLTSNLPPPPTTSTSRLIYSSPDAIPMPGNDNYNETLYILLCFSNATKGYAGLKWSPARHYLDAVACALRHTPDEAKRVGVASKQSYEALVGSLGALKYVEKEVCIAAWARSHAKQGLEVMYAAELAKLQWAMAALDEFASLGCNTG
ncbi:hypothetical protein LTR56_019403 [Elasticomyces elasticus]|nr:hypothetical protein LTR22_023429 [Elasticomyces elasticus]KAK3627079.1 hypothetical protein LTR56_019403 [Elasticomyces elasticus]KAK4904713.1 hypothetical protein LTR49_025884 [Elasticomyces elasticus]KAK5746521.1 hypothetical protein LTS12_022704 [Elasticomyces elasticus]